MTTTKKDTINTIKARMEEIEPYIREYNAYIAALEALGAPVQIPVQDFIRQPATTPEEQPPRRKRRRLIGAPVAKEQRHEEIIGTLYDHPADYLTVQQISDRTPSESTPGAIGHRMRELMDEQLVEKFSDPETGRTTIDGFYAYRITDKGVAAYEALHPEVTKEDKAEVQKRRAKMTIHAGHGIVPPSR